ncbi:sugar phosphate isomerase/epimerase family protein, partial [Pseudactinotalea sp.]|uniref:sugar phosphate isomerase/epimerase family protein n=1 Tax=Pseudactinotalea sp. TaxID=1926260 RepID=UPI003B3A519B
MTGELDPRVICSTITLRHLPLPQALDEIARRGFAGIDLGALPGVCDHVPYDLDDRAVRAVAGTVAASGLRVRSINADIGDLNVPDASDDDSRVRDRHLDHLLDLAAAIDADAVVLPNGGLSHAPRSSFAADLGLVAGRLEGAAERAASRGREVWVEAPHLFRLVHTVDGAAALSSQLSGSVGLVCDVSHVVASGGTPRDFLTRFADRTRHVHLRDASLGYIHHSIGRGEIDFADVVSALDEHGYRGDLALELETRDLADADRGVVAREAGLLISGWLAS